MASTLKPNISPRSPNSDRTEQPMLKKLLLTLALAPLAVPAAELPADFAEHISALTDCHTGTPVKLKKNGGITTKATFKPPVEIVVEAKTDSTNLRKRGWNSLSF